MKLDKIISLWLVVGFILFSSFYISQDGNIVNLPSHILQLKDYGLLYSNNYMPWESPKAEGDCGYNYDNLVVKGTSLSGALILSYQEIEAIAKLNKVEFDLKAGSEEEAKLIVGETVVFSDSIPLTIVNDSARIGWVKELKFGKEFSNHPYVGSKEDPYFLPVNCIDGVSGLTANSVVIFSSQQINLGQENGLKVSKSTTVFGNAPDVGRRTIIKVDINNYSSYDVVRFIEDFNCLSTSENEEDESYYASMIAIRYTNKWFRTFFYEKGMDGVEGF